jgi:cell division transport system permease protein
MGGEVIPNKFPRRLGIVIAARNLFDLVLFSGCRNWARGLAGSLAALASIALLALLAGVAGLTALALTNISSDQAAKASVLRVYLRDDATGSDISSLQNRLTHDPRVAGVTYTSKAAALAKAQNRPGMTQLVEVAGSNPIPASLEVRVRSLSDIHAVAASVTSEGVVDPEHPSSFDGGTYGRLQFAFRTLAAGGAGLLLLLIVVAAAVTAGSIRSTLLARREEVEVMWLVGSPRWMIGGPFLVEGALTGGFGAAVGGALAFALGLAVLHAQAGAFSVFLPGVTLAAMATLLAVLIASGIGLGSVAAFVGVRDLRR